LYGSRLATDTIVSGAAARAAARGAKKPGSTPQRTTSTCSAAAP
jgi:hypothetical protein